MLNEETEMMIPTMKQPFITIIANERHSRVEVHLRGTFDSPQDSSQQLTQLYQLAEQYDTVLVYITSSGGRVDLLMDLYNAIRKFETVITVIASEAASAGFMLWCIGDVRVTCPYAEFMAHRETSGAGGKTEQIIDRAEFLRRRFEKIFVDFCGGVLTEDEVQRAKLTEIWFTGQDMIDRGAAISINQFQELDTEPCQAFDVIKKGDSTYLRTGNLLTPVDVVIQDEAMYSIFEIMYEVPNPRNLLLEDLGDGDTFEEEAVDFGEEMCPQDSIRGDSGNVYPITGRLTKQTARDILRLHWGKGQYQLFDHQGGDYTAYVILNRKKTFLLTRTSDTRVSDLIDALDALEV